MTICLPLDLKQFRQDFDSTIKRILETSQDVNFYSLITALTANFEQHPLFKEFMKNLKAESKNFIPRILNECEQIRSLLLNHPNITRKQRKTLSLVEKSVFAKEPSLIPPYILILSEMQKIQLALGMSCSPLNHSPQHKRAYMQRVATTNASFCWDRLVLLQQCGDIYANPKETKLPTENLKNTQLQIWENAHNRYHHHLVLKTCNFLMRKFAIPPEPSFDESLPIEYQIHREDYEEYLKSWQNHVYSELARIDNQKYFYPENQLLKEPLQKRAFVIEITGTYYRENPKEKRDDAYSHYCLNCPERSKPLSKTQWNRIVRKYKLDPRKSSEKVRGKGK